MLIRLGYDIQFDVSAPVAFVAQLRVHPSRHADLREPDVLHVEGLYAGVDIPSSEYIDSYGNVCTRFYAQPGPLRPVSYTHLDVYKRQHLSHVEHVERGVVAEGHGARTLTER